VAEVAEVDVEVVVEMVEVPEVGADPVEEVPVVDPAPDPAELFRPILQVMWERHLIPQVERVCTETSYVHINKRLKTY